MGSQLEVSRERREKLAAFVKAAPQVGLLCSLPEVGQYLLLLHLSVKTRDLSVPL